MKKIIFLVFLFFSVASLSAASWDSWATVPAPIPAVPTNTPIVDSWLHIKDIISKDLSSLNLVFGEKVQVDTVKVKVVKQSDNSSVDVGDITAEKDAKMIDTVKISFTSDLEGGTSYKLTVISATSESWKNIKEWVDAIKEFATPIKAPVAVAQNKPTESTMTLNAPDNKSAVLSTATPTPTPVPTKTVTPPVTPPAVEVPKAPSLPVTGMNPLFLLIIALPVALLFLVKRRSV